MPMHRPRRATIRALSLVALTFCFGLGLGCTEEGDTIVVDGLDCGLIRNDLIGDWVVSFVAGGTTLVNCDDTPSSNGRPVDVAPGSVTYGDVTIYASAESTSFLALFDDPSNPQPELIGSVEADSCLALVQIWESDDEVWMQCIGTFDRTNGTIRGVCDSVDLDRYPDPNPDGKPDAACDLNASLFVDILVP
jgi:hypothetical protein